MQAQPEKVPAATAARLKALLAINRALISELDPAKVLDMVVEKAREFFGADACVAFLEREGELVLGAATGLPEGVARALRVPSGKDPCPFVERAMPGAACRAFLWAPFVARDCAVGVLAVFSFGGAPRPSGPEDEELLGLMADQAALAVCNARLHDEARSERKEAEARARQLEAMIEAVPDGILVVDRQGNVVSANSALVALLGLAEREEALRPVAEYQQLNNPARIVYHEGMLDRICGGYAAPPRQRRPSPWPSGVCLP